jgi:hypothetical protein
MEKDFYEVFVDDNGREYVQQVKSELDKNHKENRKFSDTTGEAE